MKKFCKFILFLPFLSGCALNYSLKPERFNLSSSGKRVAILGFSDLRADKIKKKYPLSTKVLVEKIIAGLSRKGFSVIDRENIEKILKEQQLSMTGLIDEEEAVQVGKLSGAELVLIGSINEYQRTIYPKVKMNLTLKAISVEKGVVVSSIDVSISKSNWFYPIELLNDVIDIAVNKIVDVID